MPAREIKELRQADKLEEALQLAKSELEADPSNIWTKRNISWVYYEYLKKNATPEHFDNFLSWLTEIANLQLPADEKMLFDQLNWQTGKMVFGLLNQEHVNTEKYIHLFNAINDFSFTKPSEGYSFLFKAFHKAFKETDFYTVFADWWDFKNFMPGDFQKEKMPNGREIMSVAEQAYIAYARHLLPRFSPHGDHIFDKEKALAFIPVLSEIAEKYPQFQYPGYFLAKLLLEVGDKENMLDSLLPFAKKKRNDFWVWDILAESFSNDPEKVFACYCKALSCFSTEEMLVSLRRKMAGLLISKKMYNEARTEIELLVKARNEHGFRIPNEVINWQSQDWYINAKWLKSNADFYRKFTDMADSLLYSDTPEETVIVAFVNSDKKILNFIASETKYGFFKYNHFFKEVKIGETLKVRFQAGAHEGMHQVYTAVKTNDLDFSKQFLKDIEGAVKIPIGKSFGFLDDVFIHPTAAAKMKLIDGMHLKGTAIKYYNREKNKWTWKLI